MSENTFEDQLRIDLNNLHLEINNQARFLNIYRLKKTNALMEFKRQKNSREVLYSELFMEYKDSDDYQKANLDYIKSLIITDARYRKATKKMLKAEESFNIYDDAVKAIESRGSMLKEEIRLFEKDYYLKDVTEKDTFYQRHKKLSEMVQDETKKKIRNKLKKKGPKKNGK